MAATTSSSPLGTTKHIFSSKKPDLEREAKTANVTVHSRDPDRVLMPDVQATMCLYHMEVQESLWPVIFPVVRHLLDNRKLVMEELYVKLGLGPPLAVRHVLLDGIITYLKAYMRTHDDRLPDTLAGFLPEPASASPAASSKSNLYASPRPATSNPAGSPMSVDTTTPTPTAAAAVPIHSPPAHSPPRDRLPISTPPAPFTSQLTEASLHQPRTATHFDFSVGPQGTPRNSPQYYRQHSPRSSRQQRASPQHQPLFQQQPGQHHRQDTPRQQADSQWFGPQPQHQPPFQQQHGEQQYSLPNRDPPSWKPSPPEPSSYRGDVIQVKNKGKVLDAIRLLSDQFFDPEPCCDGLAVGKIALALAHMQSRLERAREVYQEELDKAFKDFTRVVQELPCKK